LFKEEEEREEERRKKRKEKTQHRIPFSVTICGLSSNGTDLKSMRIKIKKFKKI